MNEATGQSRPADPAPGRRPPEVVMRLARLGSFHQTRLSFMRALLRRLRREQWRFRRGLWQMDDDGFGRAVYTVQGPERAYSLLAFSHYLADEDRSDRVIATAWDATFALFDGVPDAADVERLAGQVPRQEAGRLSDRELSLSRANKSVRLWRHVVERLAAGEQPDAGRLDSVGYLMRTTAVYGSGKFGAADRLAIADRPEFAAPFRAEMLSVWLTRAFTVDLVEHVAAARGGARAVALDPALRRRLGVGNSTGLGMAPFLVNHPALLNNWILAREEALARVRALRRAGAAEIAVFRAELERARDNAAGWHSEHPLQVEKLERLRADLGRLEARVADAPPSGDYPWDRLFRWAESELSLEGQEQLVSLLLEPHGELVDGLVDCMDADEQRRFFIDGAMPLGHLRELLERRCDWALAVDYEDPAQCARFWYTSEEKLEPRLGERHAEPGAERELPLATGRAYRALYEALAGWRGEQTTAAFLLAHPEHRHTVRRAQVLARHPYAEIRDNLIAADLLPIDILRCKLSFFGATRFDPRSDRWVRICMYRDAPYPHEWLAPAS